MHITLDCFLICFSPVSTFQLKWLYVTFSPLSFSRSSGESQEDRRVTHWYSWHKTPPTASPSPDPVKICLRGEKTPRPFLLANLTPWSLTSPWAWWPRSLCEPSARGAAERRGPKAGRGHPHSCTSLCQHPDHHPKVGIFVLPGLRLPPGGKPLVATALGLGFWSQAALSPTRYHSRARRYGYTRRKKPPTREFVWGL